jgi:hypothetical protein
MWATVRPRILSLAALDRVRLRRFAGRYAARGWAVIPGACLSRHSFACGRPGCPVTGCHPAVEQWEQVASSDPARIAGWWRDRPHALLLATGRAFDVVEVPAYLGQRVLRAIRSRPVDAADAARTAGPGPVAVTPIGRWMFLVRPGDPLRPELADCLYVLQHGPGSWIPAPPTRLPEGAVRWMVAPERIGWRLPDSSALQGILVDTLRAIGPGPPSALLPGQLPAPRRGW